MPAVKLPRYLRAKTLRDGATAYYWERPTWANPPAERGGVLCFVDSEPLGPDLAHAIGKAELLNAQFDAWKLGGTPSTTDDSVAGLFGWYRGLDRFRELKPKTQRDYRAQMKNLGLFELKTTTLGEMRVMAVEARHADALYRAMQTKHGVRGATYAMQVARRVWFEAIRHKKARAPNPFERMGLTTSAEHGNRETTRPEYDRFRTRAHALGRPSMAAAAALGFELARRVNDVFGFLNGQPEDEAPCILWEDYEPGVRIRLRQGKTGKVQSIALRGAPDPKGKNKEVRERGALLYPDLEQELKILRGTRTNPTGHMILDERTGKRYSEDSMGRQFRRIRDKEGLPQAMTPTGFRHGGMTEMGDAGIEDTRAVGGHDTLQQTATYKKARERQSRIIGEQRRRHVESEKRKEPK